uniref:Uncharacterized protein n=1 Tax=Cacopsylla melanoneura TaxID=428564 RepID=A0A8D8Q7F4_9HEMI
MNRHSNRKINSPIQTVKRLPVNISPKMTKKKCSACNTVDDHISCDRCSEPFCNQCADISLAESRILKKNKFKYECVTCSNSKDTDAVTKYEKNISKLSETITQVTVDNNAKTTQ